MQRFYGLEDQTDVPTTVMLGLQHVLAMFVGIVSPPIIVAAALGLGVADTAFLVSISLFTSGITTCVQVSRIGPVGSGLLSVQGTSFVFVPLAIATGKAGGLPLIFGMSMAGAVVPIVFSRCLTWARRIFPPVVTGSVVMLIGMSLIKVGFAELAGGFGASDFGSPANFGLGMFVMGIIILVYRLGVGFMRTISIAVGLVAGYLLALLLGRVDLAPVGVAAWGTIPHPLRFGLAFDMAWLVPWMIAYMTVVMECIGDLTATSAVSREPVTGPVFLQRLQGGILSDGLGCAFTSLFNAMPKTTFAQNNGVIALTGVASRRVGLAVGGLLIVLGLFPKLAAVVSIMPQPVLGGATVIMFAMVAVAGFHIIQSDGLTPRTQFILAITLALGMGVTMVPDAVAKLGETPVSSPWMKMLLDSVKIMLESGLAIGAITAIALNFFLPHEEVEPAVPELHAPLAGG